jgi:hypothetical protein
VNVSWPALDEGPGPVWSTGSDRGRVLEHTVTIHCDALI